jgi:NitT/TauT family transport system permease protein
MRVLRAAAFYVLLLAAWQILASLRVWDATLFPGPVSVGQTLWELIRSGTLADATEISLRRVLFGYLFSVVVGVPLGVFLARNRIARETFGTLVTALQALPSICWLPLALLWYGLNDRAIVFVVVMGSLTSVTIAVKDGVRNLPPTYERAALTMGTSPLRLYTDVLLPASLPSVLTGAKLGWAYAWRALMAGELLYVSLGLGHLLQMGRELADMSQVIAIMVVIGSLGLFTDLVIFASLERRVRSRFGLGR